MAGTIDSFSYGKKCSILIVRTMQHGCRAKPLFYRMFIGRFGVKVSGDFPVEDGDINIRRDGIAACEFYRL